MVTKKELQDTWRAERDAWQVEVDKLEIALKDFKVEEQLESDLREEYRELGKKIDVLTSHAYDGNFGDSWNRSHSRVPDKMIVELKKKGIVINEKDGYYTSPRKEILEVLEDMRREKTEQITTSKEYLALHEEQDAVWKKQCEAVSGECQDIRTKLEDLRRKISWCDSRINEVENKGELIKWGKIMKEREVREKQEKETSELKQKIRNIIMEAQ